MEDAYKSYKSTLNTVHVIKAQGSNQVCTAAVEENNKDGIKYLLSPQQRR